ncbi:DUF885 domain-containing protein [Pontimicrobium aquaticum]|uniref:DUF885 domain-containing protein n=1 Tax=Pontimicrobium aquaticum TaxID=2565367 RepID=A0A4U0F0Q9_9FLAO|nr:DUF885 domain-containing protein [Pontimicrobium aquaticum]TJY37810.1 DUF885 domain-containing protein [Pontimicrobium aquaticum]
MIRSVSLLTVFFLLIFSCKNERKTIEWDEFSQQFQQDFKKLSIAPLAMSYIENIKSIKSNDSIQYQESFFKYTEASLKKIKPELLTKSQWLDYELIKYETRLNLERINLEKEWKDLKIDSVSTKGIYNIPNGKEWYAYFLKKWVDEEVNPDAIYQFGLKEIERVKSKIKDIQISSGMDSISFQKHINQPSFFYNDEIDIQEAFEMKQYKIDVALNKHFPFLEKIPKVTIARIPDENLVNAPAFYTPKERTFYYNYRGSPYNKRQISWVYIHEAIPGHHYQLMLDKVLPRSSIQRMFEYYGFLEGYAAYIEEIGFEINAYEDIYEELGKWEWDIIRSVRIVLDVGINYYGWDDYKAMNFWRQHIQNKDDIALREIARIKRWPAQVITYKYGADKLIRWKKKYLAENDTFGLKDFHKLLLENGSLPLSIINKTLNNKPK